MLYKHKKTGHLYRVIANATDCTNSRDSNAVVVYSREGSGDVFVRDAAEFREKFDLVETDAIIAEARSVLDQLDHLADVWGDEGVFRTCLDRLRALVMEGKPVTPDFG